MSCKDCIHFDICDSWYKNVEAEGLAVGEMSQQMCGNFKNKADFVEVVRCKDCKFWGTPHNTCSVLGNLTTEGLVQTSPDWFCALGERKDKS